MKTICTVTFVRNAAKYIVPHLNMYKGLKNYVCYMTDKPKNWYIYPDEKDNSEELIQKYFPNIETFTISGDDYNGDMINRVREKVSEDIMIFLHADVIFSDSDFKRLIDFIENNDYALYKLDMSKCMIDYYYDFEHGARDCIDKDPIAISRVARFHSKYWTDVVPNNIYTIDWSNFTAHHFNGWKGDSLKKEWLESPIAKSISKDGWLKCPCDIKEKFI